MNPTPKQTLTEEESQANIKFINNNLPEYTSFLVSGIQFCDPENKITLDDIQDLYRDAYPFLTSEEGRIDFQMIQIGYQSLAVRYNLNLTLDTIGLLAVTYQLMSQLIIAAHKRNLPENN